MNDVEIDLGIAPLIQTLWDNDIETIQCCQGGYTKEKSSRLTHIGPNGENIENAHIIFLKKDLDNIKEFLPKDTDYIIGDSDKKGHLAEWLGAFEGAWANFILK